MKKNQTVVKGDLPVMVIAVVAGVALVMLAALSACGQDSSEIEVISSEEYARAFLAHDPVVVWDGGFSFRRIYPNGYEEWVSGQFQLDLDLFITSLVINEQVILTPDDQPLGGLPTNGEGACTEFFLYLSGRDQAGWNTAYGSFQTGALRPGDPIVVTLSPASRQHFVPFDVPEGVNPNDLGLTLLSDPGIGWWGYNSYRGGFEIWLGVMDDLRYEIFNLVTGEVYRRGELGEGEDEESSAISLSYQGGVKAIGFGDLNWVSLNRQSFDALVDRGGSVLTPAAVYMADLAGAQAQLYVSGLTGPGRVEVFAWTEVGDMPIIAWTRSLGEADPWGFVLPMSLSVPAGYDKVIITITGETDDWGFYFNLNLLQDVVPVPGIGGKG